MKVARSSMLAQHWHF